MRKKRAALAVVGITAGILLAGCAQQTKDADWKANENSVYVTRDGQVQSALVYSSEQFNELYQEEELKAFAEKAVAEFNEESSLADGETEVIAGESADGNESEKPPVALTSCKLDNRTGYLVFDYAGPEDYLEFAKFSGDNTNTITDLSVTVPGDGAIALLLDPDTEFVTPAGKDGNIKKVMESGDYCFVFVEGAGTICTEGKIVMASPGTVFRDAYTAVTAEGANYIIFK